MNSYTLFLLLCITALSILYVYTVIQQRKQKKRKKSTYDFL